MKSSRWAHDIVGRESELAALNGFMSRAISGKGSAVIISGEAGIGKTRLVDEFVRQASAADVSLFRGEATSDSGQPFLVFSSALDMTELLFQETESVTFTALFAVNKAGLLVAQSASESDGAMDADIFAGMLSAVQNFVRDSFDSSGAQQASLGRLEYGNMKIIIKHGEDLFLAAVLSGQEHEDMETVLKRTVESIETEYGHVLRGWKGKLQEAAGIQASIDALASRKFPVRRNLVGLKLENERLRIANIVFEKLVALSNAKPVMLLLEDLHWADESSLVVLSYLARNIGQERMLLVGTCRPSESKALGASMEKMKAENTLVEINLQRLGSDSLKSLVNSMVSPNDLPADFVERLAVQCAGNPFFATEILKQMIDEGSIAPADGRYVLVNKDYSIPDTVEEAVQRRLESLESDAMAMVEYVSCVGTFFDRGTAMAMPSLRDPSAALDRLVSSGIIIIEEDASFFCHAIFQDVTYRSIGDRWRLAYHKSIGEHYERSRKDDGEFLYELARHFFRSSEKKKAHRYCIKAADMAEASFAPEQAISFLTDASSLVPALKLGAGEAEARMRLIERIADLAELMGDYDLAMSRLNEMAESAELKDDEVKARAIRKTMHLMEIRGRFEEGLKASEKAKGFLGNRRNHEMAMVLMNEGTIYEQMRKLDRSIDIQREALSILTEADAGHKDIARVYARIGTCLWMKNDFDAALECYLKGLEISEANRDLRGIAAAMNNIGIVYIRKGDYNSADDYLRKGRDIYQKIGDQSGMASSSGNLGNVCIAKGDHPGAMAAYEICLKVFTRLGAKMALGATTMNIGSIYEHIGEFGKAMEFYRRSRDIRIAINDRRGLSVTTLNMGNLLYDMGDYESSIWHLEDARAIMEEVGERNGLTHALCGIVRGKIKLGRLDGCAELLEKALSLSRELGMAENEKTALVLYGKLAVLSGDWEKAGESFADCIDYGRSGGYKRILADALWGQGTMLAARKDIAAAVKNMEEARELYVEMGQPHLVKEIDADLVAVRAA